MNDFDYEISLYMSFFQQPQIFFKFSKISVPHFISISQDIPLQLFGPGQKGFFYFE